MQSYKYYFHSKEQEFWFLWLSYSEKLSKQCLSWTGNNHVLTEDIMSGVVLHAHSKYLKFGGKILNVYAWLSKMIYNHLMGIYRSEKRKQKILEQLIDEHNITSTDHNLAEPDQEIQYLEAFESLDRLINRLPVNLKETYQLHVMSCMDYEDISKKLNITKECARKRVQLARQRINEMARYL